jgi:hypothetical protein
VAPSLEALDMCQKDRGGRSRLCHLKGEFEFQMEVGSGGMEGGHVAVPQSGSYNAMWQEGKARDMWHPHRSSGKGKAQDLRHLGLV